MNRRGLFVWTVLFSLLLLLAGGPPASASDHHACASGKYEICDNPKAGPDIFVKKWLAPNASMNLSDGNCLAPLTATSEPKDGYHYAWKQFLYMTSRDQSGEYRFTQFGDSVELFTNPNQTYPPKYPIPPDYPGAAGITGGQTGKHITLSDVRQAAALVPAVDRNGRWLQYSVLVNEPEWDCIKGQKLYESTVYNEIGCSGIHHHEDKESCKSGQTCVTPDGSGGCAKGRLEIQLPDDSIELKLSWRVLETCDLPDSPGNCTEEKTDAYITIKTSVNPYGPGKLFKEVDNVTLGLVGMHILSKTKGNPDWAWTTFEYKDNAEDCPGSSPSVPSTFGAPHWNSFCPPDPVPLLAWTGQLENPNNPFDPKQNNYLPAVAADLAENGQAVLSYDSSHLLCTSNLGKFQFAFPPLYQPNVDRTLQPTAVCRVTPIPSKVAAVNTAVHAQIRKSGTEHENLLSYELVGAFWFNKNCRESHTTNVECPTTGDSQLANTTLETFEQQIGCTVCHGQNQFNPFPYKKPIAQGIADRSFIFQRLHAPDE